jgi:hypothetical protein
MNKWSWTIGLTCSFLIALASGRAEARDIRIKGDFAGTGLTARIDLNNDGRLADGGTWVEKSNLGQSSAQFVIEGVPVDPPSGACPAGQLERALVAGNVVNTFLHTRDQLFIQLTSRIFCFDLATSTFSGHTIATITGGTGKFVGATGSVDYRFTGVVHLADFDPASNQLFVSFTGTVEGTLTLPKR